MFRRILSHKTAGQFARYATIGGGGAIIDLITLMLFKELLGLSALVAVVLNQVIMVCYGFLGQKYWTFKERSLPHKQLVRYLLLVLFNYILAVLLMYVFHTIADVDYLVVRIGSIGLSVCWNFLLYKYWIFR